MYDRKPRKNNKDNEGTWFDNENNEPDDHELKPGQELDFDQQRNTWSYSNHTILRSTNNTNPVSILRRTLHQR